MTQEEACDILFPAAAGDLTLLLESIYRFDDIFFETLRKLKYEAAQIADPRAEQGVEAVTTLVHDRKQLSVAVIYHLFTSHDFEARCRLCENNAVFMDDKFFEIWRTEVIAPIEQHGGPFKAKHVCSRYNEAVACVRVIVPDCEQVPFVSTFGAAQRFYNVPPISSLLNSDISCEQATIREVSNKEGHVDGVQSLRTYAEAGRAYPDFSTDAAKFSRLAREISADFGWNTRSDDQITILMKSAGPTFNSKATDQPDMLEAYLEIYKRIMRESDQPLVSRARIATLPVACPNARCVAAQDGDAVIVCYYGLLEMLDSLNDAIASAVVGGTPEQAFGDRAKMRAPNILNIMRGQRHELPFVGETLKHRLGFDLYKLLHGYGTYQMLFLIGHEVEHLKLGHLASAPRMSHSPGDSHPSIDLMLFSRRAEFAADLATLKTLLGAGAGTNALVAVDILFQYLDLWEDLVGSSLPTVSDHPTALERRAALRQLWPKDLDKKEYEFPIGVVMAFLDSVRKEFLSTGGTIS